MITIVIPTFKRPDFIVRTLRYYAEVGFGGEILVGDSSDGEAAALARAAVARHAPGLRATHLDCRGLDVHFTLHKLVDKVRTPYVTFIGDDDLVMPSGLERCVAFLQANPSHVAANGNGWAFDLQPGPVYGRLNIYASYPQPGLEQARPFERLAALLGDYQVTLFSVHRAEAWREMWRRAPELPDRAFAAELLPCCLSPVLGRIRHLDCFYLLRQGHAARYMLPEIARWIEQPDWRRSYEMFCERIADGLRSVEGSQHIGAEARVAELFERFYLPRFMQAPPAPPAPPATAAPPEPPARPPGNLRRLIRAIPGARPLFRRLLGKYGTLRHGGAPYLAPPPADCHALAMRALAGDRVASREFDIARQVLEQAPVGGAPA